MARKLTQKPTHSGNYIVTASVGFGTVSAIDRKAKELSLTRSGAIRQMLEEWEVYDKNHTPERKKLGFWSRLFSLN